MTVCALPGTVFDGVIDVSHHNGAIDWPAVAAAGIALSLYQGDQGGGFVDRMFAANRRGAGSGRDRDRAVSLSRSAAIGEEQASHFLDVAGIGAGQPGMLDWETAAPATEAAAFGAATADRRSVIPLRITDLRNWPRRCRNCRAGR